MSGDEIDINKILAQAAVTSTKDAYNSLKEKFLTIWKEASFKKKYGFPLTNYINISEEMDKIRQEGYFQRLKTIIGKDHWAINFIKVGISIANLSELGARKQVDEIRTQIYRNKGWKALNIATMGSTGAIRGVINYIENLKDKGYESEAIIEEFENIVDDWEKITIFVDKSADKNGIEQKIQQKIANELILFFVFSYGLEASRKAMESIAELRNQKQIEEKGYIFDTSPRFDGVGTQIYMWSFKSAKYDL